MTSIRIVLAVACAALFSSPAFAAAERDYGDQASSTLTAKAWAAFVADDVAGAIAFAGRCVELYTREAEAQQAEMAKREGTPDNETIHAQWALNDVGTSLYVIGQAHEKAGRAAEAVKAYRVLVERLALARCWDENGWFWSPADAARGRMRAIEFEAAM